MCIRKKPQSAFTRFQFSAHQETPATQPFLCTPCSSPTNPFISAVPHQKASKTRKTADCFRLRCMSKRELQTKSEVKTIRLSGIRKSVAPCYSEQQIGEARQGLEYFFQNFRTILGSSLGMAGARLPMTIHKHTAPTRAKTQASSRPHKRQFLSQPLKITPINSNILCEIRDSLFQEHQPSFSDNLNILLFSTDRMLKQGLRLPDSTPHSLAAIEKAVELFRLETKDTVFWVRATVNGVLLVDEIRDVGDREEGHRWPLLNLLLFLAMLQPGQDSIVVRCSLNKLLSPEGRKRNRRELVNLLAALGEHTLRVVSRHSTRVIVVGSMVQLL